MEDRMSENPAIERVSKTISELAYAYVERDKCDNLDEYAHCFAEFLVNVMNDINNDVEK